MARLTIGTEVIVQTYNYREWYGTIIGEGKDTFGYGRDVWHVRFGDDPTPVHFYQDAENGKHFNPGNRSFWLIPQP
jgi:hypothetical protein